MTSTPFWLDDPKAWGTGVLGSHTLPGIVTADPDEIARQLDRKKPQGKSGGPIEDKGYKPIKAKITLTIRTREQHEAWLAILPSINPRREGSTKNPMEFRHPAVDEFDVGPWVVASIKPAMPSAKGGRKIEIILEEYFAETKKVKKSTGTVEQANPIQRDVNLANAQFIEMFRDAPLGAPIIEDPTSPESLSTMVGDLTGTNRE